MLKKVMTGAAIALTLGGAALATATPAAAQRWHGGGYYGGYHRGYGGGAVLGAGLLGLAVGAAVSGGPHYYGYPPPAYYGGPAYYGYYGGCHSHWRWDPYLGRYVAVERCY